MCKGLFITVEGTDGSGKTTQIKLMEEFLKAAGNDVVLSREPGGTEISETIRNLILDPGNKDISPLTEMLLYAAARAQHVFQVIRPSLESGKCVICDRFVDSSYAYQGCGRGVDLKTVADVNRAAVDGVVPDITFFLNIDPRLAIERRIKSTGADRIEQEKMDFHMRVYEGYRKMALLYPDRIKSIDASKSIEEISLQIKTYLKEIL
ncbi:thymidylate kinase [Ruminiclostridium papyrosolvens DSM 2782]|uniref:Thymidylate kinase n=1 Tax=Ruminiclostridium papyrosolvens DSM 2782 TaxID=588581 RepID=F1TCW5_9FIRM|nr:dTMP kinase [Ruminiclostridium papyrosolvens]EGD47832.1 thymidylate kinase [Ruminiclostridium papyrosolvens DSM 2782]WES34548.1 dTMP kinase [Ruminiclostridium papyrosolvens DSM 2782]